MPLTALSNDPLRLHPFVDEAIAELEDEMTALGGIKGKAISAGYRAVTKVKPEFVPENIRRLIPMCAPSLDEHVAEARKAGMSIDTYFEQNADPIAEDLLAATDSRALVASNTAAVNVYEKLRPSAKERVVSGMPRLAKLVERHHDA